ncbi:MipA/OmpV family protein [Mesorhizobium xinjiangense]|uniref:MipA/OmpV family protein n=1 Tax=Mesorhizobium xinjiangense TaxID=2678685 RepID=UPI001F216243|nr:MipA/OmpV family protein [Mesorhizobium xinjiangense]
MAAQAYAADPPGEYIVPATQEVDPTRFGGITDKLNDWKVVIGAGAFYLPEYEGSDKFEVRPFPLFSAQFGDRVHLDIRGITFDVYEQSGFRLAVRGGYELGRQEDDSDYLRGLGDIDAGGVVGGLVSYQAGPFELYAEIDKTIGGSEGLTANFGAKVSHRYERFIFSADASGTWADDNHMETYFSVTPTQSFNSGLPVYEAGAGMKRVNFQGSITYMMTEHWMVTGAAGAGLLIGDAKDSPIVKDDVQPFARIGLGYRF